jgi:hypothetical protein
LILSVWIKADRLRIDNGGAAALPLANAEKESICGKPVNEL